MVLQLRTRYLTVVPHQILAPTADTDESHTDYSVIQFAIHVIKFTNKCLLLSGKPLDAVINNAGRCVPAAKVLLNVQQSFGTKYIR